VLENCSLLTVRPAAIQLVEARSHQNQDAANSVKELEFVSFPTAKVMVKNTSFPVVAPLAVVLAVVVVVAVVRLVAVVVIAYYSFSCGV
jgi:hypothetical protein